MGGPLPGAKDFLTWLKPFVPRCFMISDSFEEFAMPVFQKLGHPMVFCNFLESDDEGYLARHVVRLQDQKRLAVEEFQRLNFRVIAIGSSYLDIPMLKSAERGILFNPTENLSSAHPEIPCAQNYEGLKAKILDIVNTKECGLREEEIQEVSSGNHESKSLTLGKQTGAANENAEKLHEVSPKQKPAKHEH